MNHHYYVNCKLFIEDKKTVIMNQKNSMLNNHESPK